MENKYFVDLDLEDHRLPLSEFKSYEAAERDIKQRMKTAPMGTVLRLVENANGEIAVTKYEKQRI